MNIGGFFYSTVLCCIEAHGKLNFAPPTSMLCELPEEKPAEAQPISTG
jgi:hypothetical protein